MSLEVFMVSLAFHWGPSRERERDRREGTGLMECSPEGNITRNLARWRVISFNCWLLFYATNNLSFVQREI